MNIKTKLLEDYHQSKLRIINPMAFYTVRAKNRSRSLVNFYSNNFNFKIFNLVFFLTQLLQVLTI